MPRVLVVDDEKNVLKTLKIGLKRRAFHVVEAETGPQALDMLQQDHFDILLSDIRMKPMDGYTLAANAREAHPELGIILMSAYGFEESHYETMEQLSCSRITKPFPIEELIQVIQREMNKGRQGSLMVIGDAPARKMIREVVETAGYHMVIGDESTEDREPVDLLSTCGVLVDGESLNDDRLKVLNRVDREAPDLPVILLARKGGETAMDNGDVTVLERNRFFKDAAWAESTLRRTLIRGESPD